MKLQLDEIRCKIAFKEVPKRTKLAIGLLMLISVVTAVIVTINFAFIKYEWVNVHLVPHTHDDVGWLKTPEEYYDNYVKYILTHVVLELQKNPSRKFVYAETYFLWKWWQEQCEPMRTIVRYLIQNKQLEIVGGGWTMSDEAVTHYQSFIDQSTWGFRRLNDTFGPSACPTVGWQIDTFGHSKGIASLLSQMGFSSLFFARIDLNERKYRKSHKLLEFVWTGNKNLGDFGSIFTSVFYDHYSAPTGFDFEIQGTQTSVDFGAFSTYVRRHAQFFKTENIIVPMGDDFRYFNARKYFHKMDILIRFFEENPVFKIKIFYSTPSQYIQALNNADLSWPVKQGDFFPYASDHHSYWTGFYTSRPTLKYFSRMSNNFLQVLFRFFKIVKQLLVFSNLGMAFFTELTSLREAVGVLQHHDAITGTSQQYVTNHYSNLLHRGIMNCQNPLNYALKFLSQGNLNGPIYTSCLLLNISTCEVTERSSRFVVTVYNPLSRKVDYYVRVPVMPSCYTVLTADGAQVLSQIVYIPYSVRMIPGRQSTTINELLFKAVSIPAMGFKSFYVTQVKCGRRKRKRRFAKKKFKAIFNPVSRLLTGVKTAKGNVTLSQSMRYYRSTPHLSGAYLFNPLENKPLQFGGVSMRLINSGFLVKEYEQIFSSWASQVIRIYADEDYIEFEWLVGPIPIQDCIGKEVIMYYNTTVRNGKVFYTDVNGMDMEKRVKDYQSWRDKVFETVSGNYYPVTTMIALKDDYNQVYIVVDRSQGGSSLQSGEVQLMVHRRLCYDDGKGVDEPLNETAYGRGLVARGRHWVLFGERDLRFDQRAKLFSQDKNSEPWLFFFDARSVSFEQWRQNYVTEFSGLLSYVPRNIRILTLEPWRENTILIRFEHVFEKLPALRLANAPEDIDLKDLFVNFDVLEARETTLGADRWLSDSKRLKFRKHIYNLKENKDRQHLVRDNMTISLKPQQIRTFILTIQPK